MRENIYTGFMDASCEKKEDGHWGEGKDRQTNDPLSENV